MPNVGMGELLVVLVIALLFFGAKRVPEIARSIGKSLKSFKDGMNESGEEKSSSSEKDSSTEKK